MRQLKALIGPASCLVVAWGMFTFAQTLVVFIATLAVSASISAAHKRLRRPYHMRLPSREVVITRDVLMALRAKPVRLVREQAQRGLPSTAATNLR